MEVYMPPTATKYPKMFPAILFCLSLILVGTVVGGSLYLGSLLPDPRRFDEGQQDKQGVPEWKAEARITETIAVVRLGQFTMGMLIGVFLLCIGTYLSWIGVREKIGAEFQSEKVKASLHALGPGMVLAVCGTIIISVCLLKDFKYSEREGIQGTTPQRPPPTAP
jgi:hypothetical protein